MSTHAEFSRRLEALFITELRRQGVSDAETWAEKLHTYCSYVPTSSVTDDTRGNRDGQKAMPSTVLVIDMTNLKLGDKPVVALCESLLKMGGTPLRREPDFVRELQVIWRRCGLTDRVLRHLELLLLGCQRLALLDVSANYFSSETLSSLLHAASEVSCDVVLTDDVRAMHSSGRSREASVPSSSLSTHFSLELAQPRRNQPRRGGAVKASEGSSTASLGLNQLHLRGDRHRKQTSHGMEWQASSLATHTTDARPPRQRSPSLDGASVSASLRSYASGSAEALQKRREELFGRSTTAPMALAPSSSPATVVSSSARNAPAAAEDGVDQEATAGGGSGSIVVTGRNTFVATKSSPISPAQTSSAEKATSGGGRSSLAAVSGRSPSPRAVSPTETEAPVSTHPTGDAGGGPTPGAARVASREPFEDPNDQIDVTANLSPVLDSVLDLSALMTRDGALRQAHMFGGACNVWHVLEAYESAAEQQMRESASTKGRGSVDAATSAMLPAALLGGTTYNAITVLNLSRNHLTALCALPTTLLRLDVSVNRLTNLNGLQGCSMLTVLNARRNCLQVIRGLEKNLSVAHLFLGHNNITAVDGVAHLVLLETLDLTFNKLRSQASLRMLSLCSALRHLLLRGNPIMKSSKPGFMAVLRNLCPTLLVIDGHRLGNSSLANRALAKRNWDRQPHMIDSTKPFARAEMPRGDSNAAASSQLMSPAGMTGSHASVDGSAMSSFAFTSRRRDGHRPVVPFADGDTTASDERSMNLLHMLTRGVTTSSGYGDSLRSRHAAQQLAQSRKGEEAQAPAERKQRPTTNGRPLRGAVVKHLADQSRKYLEDTIVRRMTTVQQQLLSRDHSAPPCAGGGSDSDTAGATASDSNTRRAAVERNSYGGVAHPELIENPLADVMGYTTISPEKQQCAAIEEAPEKEAEAELLRQYTPRTPRLRRALSAKPPPPPPPTVTQTSSRPAPEHQEAPRRRAVSTGRAPSSTASGAAPRHGPAGVTRGLPARRTHRGSSEAAPATHYAVQSEQPWSKGAVQGDSRSYAALHIAEHQSWLLPEEAEIECSPITKDPRGRPTTSLNTTATLLDDVNCLHRSKAAPHSEHPRAAPPRTQKVRSPGAQAHCYPTSPDYQDPTEVEMTAVYQGSRSPSLSSRGGGRGTEQAWKLERYQRTSSHTSVHDRKTLSQSRSTSVTAAASRVARGGSVGDNASCSAPPPSSSRVKSPSMRPLHIDGAQRSRVVTWTQQLHDDTKALQEALQTLVDLLVAQRQRNMPLPESSRELPPTYLQERRRCVQILQDSGMLQDTYVPMDVVVYYGFSKAELEGEADRSMQVVAHRQGNTEANTRSWAREVAERSDVLRQVHLMGDAKTCLRYVALLVGDGREKLLQQYVDQLKESLRGES